MIESSNLAILSARIVEATSAYSLAKASRAHYRAMSQDPEISPEARRLYAEFAALAADAMAEASVVIRTAQARARQLSLVDTVDGDEQ